uniref:Uncharacterized protein n=2 Tax=Bactrocera latifrons TaxID=174628 RepID=A0A0K8W5I3_BACLA
MYEVFNWGYSNDEPPKRFSLSIVGSEINIDDPPAATATATAGHVRTYAAHHQAQQHQHCNNNNNQTITNTSGHRQNVAIDSARATTAAAAATTTTSTAGKSSQSATAATTFNYSSKTSAAVRHTNPKRRFTPSLLCSNAQNVFVKTCFLFFSRFVPTNNE